MALGTVANVGLSGFTHDPVVTGSGKGGWATCIASALATANSAGELLQPLSITNSNNVPVKLGPGVTRVAVRARYNTGVTVVGTSPVVRLFAVYADPSSGAFANDGTVKFVRIDAQSGAGVTLTCDTTNDVRDATYKYSALVTFSGLTAVDMLGGWYLIAVLETAAVLTGGTSAHVEVMALS